MIFLQPQNVKFLIQLKKKLILSLVLCGVFVMSIIQVLQINESILKENHLKNKIDACIQRTYEDPNSRIIRCIVNIDRFDSCTVKCHPKNTI